MQGNRGFSGRGSVFPDSGPCDARPLNGTHSGPYGTPTDCPSTVRPCHPLPGSSRSVPSPARGWPFVAGVYSRAGYGLGD